MKDKISLSAVILDGSLFTACKIHIIYTAVFFVRIFIFLQNFTAWIIENYDQAVKNRCHSIFLKITTASYSVAELTGSKSG